MIPPSLDTLRRRRRQSVIVALVLCASAGAWAVRPLFDASTVTDDQAHRSTGTPSAPGGLTETEIAPLPPRVLAVTLSDDLFPPEQRPTPTPVAPELRVSLVAVVMRGEAPVAYLRDDESGASFAASVGTELPSGARIVAVHADAVALRYEGFEYTLEIAR